MMAAYPAQHPQSLGDPFLSAPPTLDPSQSGPGAISTAALHALSPRLFKSPVSPVPPYRGQDQDEDTSEQDAEDEDIDDDSDDARTDDQRAPTATTSGMFSSEMEQDSDHHLANLGFGPTALATGAGAPGGALRGGAGHAGGAGDGAGQGNHTPMSPTSYLRSAGFFNDGPTMRPQSPGSFSSDSAFGVRDQIAAQAANETAQALKEAFRNGRSTPQSWRQSQVYALGRMLAEHHERWLSALCQDGRCRREALFELKTAETQIAIAWANGPSWCEKQHLETGFLYAPTLARTAAPRGLILLFSSCEYPVMHALVPLAAAVAAGNCIMVTPHPDAPAVSSLLRQLAPQYLDEDCIALHDAFYHVPPPVDFVWSADIGNPEPCMRAGSMGIPVKFDRYLKCPAIIDDPSIVPLAARRIVESAFTSAGMFPYKPSYIVTLPELKAPLITHLQQAIVDMYTGNPFVQDEYSRVPSTGVLDQVKALLIQHTDVLASSAVLDPAENDLLLSSSEDDDDDHLAVSRPLGLASMGGAAALGPGPEDARAHGRTGKKARAAKPPRGGVVEGGMWSDATRVVAPTVVVCDPNSALLAGPCPGPVLPLVVLPKEDHLEFMRARHPFGIVYHFTKRRDKFPPHYAVGVVVNDTLSPFRVNETISATLAAAAPSAISLFRAFSNAQPQIFCPRNYLAASADARSRFPPTTRGKLKNLAKRQGWHAVPPPKKPWGARVREWMPTAVSVTVLGVVGAGAAWYMRERMSR
ncbi:hypothetical protein GGF31_000091 [Allomyces arbusculus]|nr:hypothetical protein GGF31_000091 [Allomyces arbusculus]